MSIHRYFSNICVDPEVTDFGVILPTSHFVNSYFVNVEIYKAVV